MNRLLDSRLVIISTPLLLISICLAFLSPRWGTNDDIGLILTFAGIIYHDVASPFSLFSSPIYGFLMKNLYQLKLNIPWHGISQILFLSLSISAIFFTTRNLIKSEKSKYDYLIISLLITIFILPFVLLEVQFTTTAGISGLVGIGLMLSATTKFEISLSLLLQCYSFALRDQSYLLGVALLTPVILKYVYKNKALIKRIVLLLVLILVCITINKISLSNYSYKEHRDFNYNRAIVTEYNFINKIDLQKKRSLIAELGWNKNDISLLRTWFYYDKEDFSYEKFEYAATVCTSEFYSNFGLNKLTKNFAKSFRLYLESFRYSMFAVLLFLILFLNPSIVNFGILSSSLAINLGIIAFVAYVMKFPPSRVLSIFHLSCLLTPILLLYED